MEKFRITGGRPLRGRVGISGAKNSALPCMAASLLTSETVILHNIPYVRDIITQRRLLEDLGATVLTPELRTHKITASHIELFEAPYDLVKTMRASVLALGPLLARFGKAKVSLPGGCAIGTRPIDLTLSAFQALGAEVTLEAGDVMARAPKGGRLRGNVVNFDKATVTGTENLMMAASLADGETTLNNAAREPEIVDLAELLNKMGARVRGAGTPSIVIQGVETLGGAEHTIIPDRIETGTFIVAAAITKGELEIYNCRPEHSAMVISTLRQVGVEIEEVNQSTLRVKCCPRGLVGCDIMTEPHPRFPTDMQAQYMALMTQATGRSVITESIFENRFMHASEMQRMGAHIQIEGHTASVDGPTELMGARVQASDLRASASLVLAGLAASGETIIDRVYHIDRGYEKIESKLRAVGARIERLRDSITAPLSTETQHQKSNEEIRELYLERIAHIRESNVGWIQKGMSLKERASAAWQIRHSARIEARSLMADQTDVKLLQARDMAKYGNPDGPAFEDIVKQLGEIGLEGDALYQAIITGSSRTNTKVNKMFGL